MFTVVLGYVVEFVLGAITVGGCFFGWCGFVCYMLGVNPFDKSDE